MKTITHSARARDKVLHIETEGCIVNIRVGLHMTSGRPVTSIQILPDDKSRGGDGQGRTWRLLTDDDLPVEGSYNIRVAADGCFCMTEDPGDGLGERVVTHATTCPEHPEYEENR